MFDEADRQIIISRLAGVEFHSALALKTRTGHLNREVSAALRIRFLNDVASGAISLVEVSEFHYPEAERLIIRYGDRQGLRTLDALQLAVASELRLRVGVEIVVASDKVFCEVAALGGFAVLNPEHP